MIEVINFKIEITPEVRNLLSDLQLALRLADLADEMSMAVFDAGHFEHSSKKDGTPTIPIEEAVEDALRNVLAFDRPEDGFLGEEGGQSGDSATCWIVDPIDGTRVFTEGGNAWGTQIALQIDGALRLGVTSAPALSCRWWGLVGEGAWMNRAHSGIRSIQVSDRSTHGQLRWSCHPPLVAISPEWRGIADALQQVGHYVAPLPHAVLMVIEGEIEVALQLEGAPWDYAAFAAIIRAAGGHFSYLDLSTALGGIRPALFTNGVAHDMAAIALGK